MTSESVFNRKPKTTLVVITLILALIFLLLLELVLRFTPYQVLVTKGQGGFPSMFISDEKAGFDLTENFKHGIHSSIDLNYSVHTNNIGCFDSNTKQGESYNLLIGDSFTWGFGPLEKKWTTVLEQNSGQRFYKCGVMAYGPKQAFNKLKKVVKKTGIAPKTIIYAYYWNDLNDDYATPALTTYKGSVVNRIKSFDYDKGHIEYLTDKNISNNYKQYQQYGHPEYLSLSTSQKIKLWIKSHSIVANLLNQMMHKNTETKEQNSLLALGNEALYYKYLSKMSPEKHPWLISAWKKHLDNLKKMDDYAKSINSRFMIVILPTKAHVYPAQTNKQVIKNLEKSQEKLTDFLTKNDIIYLNLFDQFTESASTSKYQLYLPHDMHFSTDGEALTGKLLSEFVKKQQFLIED